MALISRTPTVEIYDPTGDRLIATPDDWLWGAAAGPAFTYDAAGPSTITLRALRVPGRADRPGDWNSRGSITEGNRVLIRVNAVRDHRTFTTSASMRAGFVQAGVSAAGNFRGVGRVIWGGTIEKVRHRVGPPGVATTMELGCLSFSRIADQSPVETRYAGKFDPVQLARTLVRTWAPGLVWDSRNPLSAGFYCELDLRPGPLSSLLSTIRDCAGPRWNAYVTPAGTVRVFESDPRTADHTLTAGVHCDAPDFENDNLARRDRIVAVHERSDNTLTTSSLSAAARYTATDPRAEIIQASSIVDDSGQGAVREYMRNILLATAYPTKRGTLTVFAESDSEHREGRPQGYDIDRIGLGDVVTVLYEEDIDVFSSMRAGFVRAGVSRAGTAGHGSGLIVQQITYEFGSVVLRFGDVVLNAGQHINIVRRELHRGYVREATS